MTKIVVDTLGGDKGYTAMVKGASVALETFSELSVVLVGDACKLGEECKNLGMPKGRFEIIDAPEGITNYDSPAEAIFKKTDSSMLKGLRALSERDDLFGMISAGNTGVLLTGAMRYLSGKKRVRPAMAAVLPAQNGSFTCLVDTGATVDCTPDMLCHFAHLGTEFMKNTYAIESPKVGLLSNGAESSKGNKLVKETYPLLENDKSINFIVAHRIALAQFGEEPAHKRVGRIVKHIKSGEGYLTLAHVAAGRLAHLGRVVIIENIILYLETDAQ